MRLNEHKHDISVLVRCSFLNVYFTSIFLLETDAKKVDWLFLAAVTIKMV